MDALANDTDASPGHSTARTMLVPARIWGKIPAGFKTVRDGHRRIVVREGLEEWLTGEMFSKGNGATTPLRGRAAIRSVRISGDETALIRSYQHGCLLRTLTGEIFFTWPPRPFRELAITEELRRRGVPTVVVCGACVQPLWGPFYKGWLVTQELRGALDLWAALSEGFARQAGTEKVWRAVASSLRVLHREGVHHKDLNLKNILVRREAGVVKSYIIDFDKAALFLGQVPARIAQNNIDRLLRSVGKLDPERNYVSEGDWNRFVDWYHGSAV
jgi:hypothetical protein